MLCCFCRCPAWCIVLVSVSLIRCDTARVPAGQFKLTESPALNVCVGSTHDADASCDVCNKSCLNERIREYMNVFYRVY